MDLNGRVGHTCHMKKGSVLGGAHSGMDSLNWKWKGNYLFSTCTSVENFDTIECAPFLPLQQLRPGPIGQLLQMFRRQMDIHCIGETFG